MEERTDVHVNFGLKPIPRLQVPSESNNELALLYKDGNKSDEQRTMIKEGLKMAVESYMSKRKPNSLYADLDFFTEILKNMGKLKEFGFTVHYSPTFSYCTLNGINYKMTSSCVIIKDRGQLLMLMYRGTSDKSYKAVFNEFQMMSDDERAFHIKMAEMLS